MQIQLSWPAKALSPNFRSRVHWPRTRALAAAKKEGYFACLAAMQGGSAPKWADPIAFIVTAYPPDRHDRDDDNLIASLKAHRDGIAKALRTDDSRFVQRPLQWGEPVKNGKIIITLEAA